MAASALTMSDVKRWIDGKGKPIVYVAEKATGDIIWQPIGKIYRQMPYFGWSYKTSNNTSAQFGNTICINIPTTNLYKAEITFSIPDITKYAAGTAYVYPIIAGYSSSAGSSSKNNVYLCLRYSSSQWNFAYYKSSSATSVGTRTTLYVPENISDIYKLEISNSGSGYAVLKLYNSSNTLLASASPSLYMPDYWLIIGGAPTYISGYPAYSSGTTQIIPAKSIAVYSVNTYDSNDTLLCQGVATEFKKDYTVTFLNSIGSGGMSKSSGSSIDTYMNKPIYTGTTAENPTWCDSDVRMFANVSDL